jgi:hypothetical protein
MPASEQPEDGFAKANRPTRTGTRLFPLRLCHCGHLQMLCDSYCTLKARYSRRAQDYDSGCSGAQHLLRIQHRCEPAMPMGRGLWLLLDQACRLPPQCAVRHQSSSSITVDLFLFLGYHAGSLSSFTNVSPGT